MLRYFSFFILICSSLLVQSQSIRTPESIASLMVKRFQSMRGFTANFTERNGGKIYNGRIIYKTPDKFRLEYNGRSESHLIVSNGETLWIYLPDIRTVSEQKILNDDAVALYTKQGVNRLISQYNFDFYKDRELRPINSFNENDINIEGYKAEYVSGDKRRAYHMLLTPKQPSVNKTGFTKIHLWIDETGMIIRILGISTTKIPVEYVFSNVNYYDVYADEAFEFTPPQSVQVLKNDLVPR